MSPHPGRWWHRLDDGRIQCDLCPRDCRLHDGQRGMCFVRQRSAVEEGKCVTAASGRFRREARRRWQICRYGKKGKCVNRQWEC